MLRLSRNRLALLVGASSVLSVMAVTPAMAAPVTCPDGRVPAFESPDITLVPEPDSGFTIWSSSVSVIAYCEDVTHPEDFSIPLAGIDVSAVSLWNTSGIGDLEMSISNDGSAPFVATPVGVTTIDTTGIVSDAAGHATFIMRAESASHPFLGGPDGTPELIGMHFDVDAPTGGTVVLPDEGLIFAETPELDSLVLFGTGAAGMAGYAMMRLRARRRD
jgi:hypothetical protein